MKKLDKVSSEMGFRKDCFKRTNNAANNILLAMENFKDALQSDMLDIADECNASELEQLKVAAMEFLKTFK